MSEQEQTALAPITAALPELSAEQYAQVREWDEARMALAGSYEAADGEYLRKIRDVLKEAGHGLWTRYLEARGIPEPTAYERIRRAEGRYVRAPHDKPMAAIGLHNPTPAQLPPPTYEPVAAWPTEYIGPDQPEGEPVKWPKDKDGDELPDRPDEIVANQTHATKQVKTTGQALAEIELLDATKLYDSLRHFFGDGEMCSFAARERREPQRTRALIKASEARAGTVWAMYATIARFQSLSRSLAQAAEKLQTKYATELEPLMAEQPEACGAPRGEE